MLASSSSLKIDDLTPAQFAKFSWWRCDQLYRKHESWGNWGSSLEIYVPIKGVDDDDEEEGRDSEFIVVEGYTVLIPRIKHAERIWIDECIVSKDDKVLTIFLKNLSYAKDWQNPTEDEVFMEMGYMSVCYRVEDEDFYVAAIHHARYVVFSPIAGSRTPGEEETS